MSDIPEIGKIPDEMVAAAQKADYEFTHTAPPNRCSWRRVPDDQVRRLIAGALAYFLTGSGEQGWESVPGTGPPGALRGAADGSND